MTRRSVELLRVAEWPRLDERALDEHVRETYQSRCAAIEAYAQGETAYFRRSWTAFQADRGRDFSVIVDGISN